MFGDVTRVWIRVRKGSAAGVVGLWNRQSDVYESGRAEMSPVDSSQGLLKDWVGIQFVFAFSALKPQGEVGKQANIYSSLSGSEQAVKGNMTHCFYCFPLCSRYPVKTCLANRPHKRSLSKKKKKINKSVSNNWTLLLYFTLLKIVEEATWNFPRECGRLISLSLEEKRNGLM